MWPFQVKCLDCENRISRLTAKHSGGRCAECEERRAKNQADFQAQFEAQEREYARRLQTGEIYRPSDSEFASATSPLEFRSAGCQWSLQPDFYREYREGKIETVNEAIADAASRSDGMLFLVSNLNGQLNFGLSEKYGVCEYINEEAGLWLYAYTESHLREQVDEENHIVQSCPCCGVGMLWYPSRFRLPRPQALELTCRVSRSESPDNVKWLESGDFSLAERGRG